MIRFSSWHTFLGDGATRITGLSLGGDISDISGAAVDFGGMAAAVVLVGEEVAFGGTAAVVVLVGEEVAFGGTAAAVVLVF